MIGLIAYLAGPGRSNEHTNMHVVCASELIASVVPGEALDAANTMALGHEMNTPKKTFHAQNHKRAQVFHVSLSLDPTQGVKDDAFWEKVVGEFMTGMELDGADGKPPCRWVAIRHGVSGNGNDHVHVAVSMIREDGTWWNTNNDFKRAQKTCREIEQAHGLRVLGQGVKTQGYAEGELQSVARRRAVAKYNREAAKDPAMIPWFLLDTSARQHMISEQLSLEEPRHELALKVRGAGAGSCSEAEYVRRLRGNGLLVRPYFAKGTTEEVAGYSVALRPTQGERPIWYGGGTLAKDLTLAALRAGWSEPGRAGALEEWRAAKSNRSFATVDRNALSGETLAEYFREISGYISILSETNVNDPAEYARVAREGAGLFAAWAVAAGDDGDENAKALGEASALFARHAQLSEKPVRAVRAPSPLFADLCTHQAVSKSRRAGAVAVVRAWANMGERLGAAFATHGWAQRSEVLRDDLKARLDSVHDAYRVINPLPAATASSGPGPTATAVAERPTRTVAVQRDRDTELVALEAKLRAAGAPEKAIAARMFAERQDKYGGKLAGGPTKNVSTVRRDNPQPKRRGPEKGISR